jgi:hypothetical protein
MLNAGIGWLMAYEKNRVAALQLHVEREARRKAGEKLKPTTAMKNRIATPPTPSSA